MATHWYVNLKVSLKGSWPYKSKTQKVRAGDRLESENHAYEQITPQNIQSAKYRMVQKVKS